MGTTPASTSATPTADDAAATPATDDSNVELRSGVRKEDGESVRRFLELLDTEQPTRDTIQELFCSFQRISPGWTFYERVKTALVFIFLVPFRLIFLLLVGSILLLVGKLALISTSGSTKQRSNDGDNGDDKSESDDGLLYKPLSRWRRMLLSVSSPLVRSILFVTFGIYHIRHQEQTEFSSQYYNAERDKSVKRAYVIIANHLGYIDILVLMYSFRGSFVAKGDCERTPVVGILARALQCMFVRKGQSLTNQLVRRVKTTWDCHQIREQQKHCGDVGCMTCMTSLVIFPEGTTTNGFSMIPFRTGVFNAGVAVKPICIQFPHKHFNLSWETIRFRDHVFRTLTQVVNNVEFTELPVYVPSAQEVENAKLFSRNVQFEMGLALNQRVVPLNRKMKFLYHSYLLGKVESETEVLKKAKELLEQDELLMDYIRFILPDYQL